MPLILAVQRNGLPKREQVLPPASLMPPPFPFTPVVAGAAAFDYPRKKLLGVIALARIASFAAEGVLAVHYGPRVLAVVKTGVFEDVMMALTAIAVGGSALSICHWVKASRKVAA